MLRALALLLLAVLVVALAWAITLLHGHVSFQVGSISVDTSTPIALTVLAALFVLLYVIIRLIAAFLRLPRTWRAWRRQRHRTHGDAAVTRALVALAAGDSSAARREAARARRLLGDTAQTLLLVAESARLAEREPEAEAAFRALAARQDAAFLGLRGLFRLAMARQDYPVAARLAERSRGGAARRLLAARQRSRLAVRTGDWTGALALTAANAPKAALATAAANAERDPATGLKLAQQAWKADPGLVPAVLAYARRLREAGKERRAQAVIRESWARAPHPDLAAFALGEPGVEVTDPLKHYQAAQQLADANPGHVESHLLLARVALTAGLTGEARRHAEAARATGLDQRRVWTLLAEIEGGDASRQALQHALVAEPDPLWRCTHCHATQAVWQPVCPACGTVGGLR